MAFTVTTGISYAAAAGTITTKSFPYTGDAEAEVSVVVPVSSTAYEVDIAFPYASIKTLLLYSGTGGLTIKTNSSGSPTDTIALTTGVPLLYSFDAAIGTGTNPLTANVTKIYVVNASTTIAPTLRIHVLYDSTPA